MRADTNYGIDVVYAIDPSVYERTRDDDGVAYGFEMDDTAREAIAGAVREQLDTPADVAELTIEPGYVRVQLEPSQPAVLGEYVSALRGVPAAYNRRNARSRDLDGIRFTDRYVAVYRPRDTADEFLDRYVSNDVGVDHAEPVFEYDRGVDHARGNGDRHVAYEFIYPLNPGMYDGDGGEAAFEWDDVVRERLETIVEDTPAWPGSSAGSIARVAAYPGFVTVHYHGGAFTDPTDIAAKGRRALKKFNRVRPVREDLGAGKTRQPKLELFKSVHIGAIPPTDGGAEAWIEAHGLEDEDGEPRDPPSEIDVDVDSGSRWSALNPFGGA